jgi:hypothetical protein
LWSLSVVGDAVAGYWLLVADVGPSGVETLRWWLPGK